MHRERRSLLRIPRLDRGKEVEPASAKLKPLKIVVPLTSAADAISNFDKAALTTYFAYSRAESTGVYSALGEPPAISTVQEPLSL
jgi:hypothetical protein